ncbi:uncharacterized protein YndB with AHSA1/START domain [Metabacillus crassostreae]|uniref:SRPBCC family protein n=1 Tax=Metabacillus crassostreae TaxID=929098 RepID=UPI00195CCF48|nr:SRPBCC family protein [Metabacillus crassostreae]MBM7603151.1 uncharacterized protein YndB with AHSA1/START domain [Metabacillus crassostreae]
MEEIVVYRYDEYIDAPIDIVFSYVNDDDKIKQWNTMFIENIYESAKDQHMYKKGISFKSVQKLDKKTITVDTHIVEYEAPYKIIMHSTTKEGVSISKYLLTREYSGTRLVVEASLIPSNIYYKLMTKIFGRFTKFIYEEQYNNLKEYVENEVQIS